MNLSFAGCGFLGIYHVGVASCFREFAPALINKVAGASAGAIAGCCLVCNCCLGQAASDLLSVVRKAHEKTLGTMHPSFSVVNYLRRGLENLLPADAHKLASGRLFISLTRPSDNQNVIVSDFESREDLIQAVVCSAFVPVWAGIKLPSYKGVVYIDGGITNNLPQIHEDTVTVSPFSGESDICPDDKSSSLFVINVSNTSIQVTLKNIYRLAHALFPPEVEVLADMCQQGFDDALKFLKNNDLISCAQCITLKSSMYLSSELNEQKKAKIAKHRETRIRKMSRKISRALQITQDNPPDIAAILSECITTPSVNGNSNPHTVLIYNNSKNNDCYKDAPVSDCSESNEPCAKSCAECNERMKVALLNRLPPTVLKSIQKACESVNMGIFGYFYKLKIVKILSYLTLPWFVPLDLICISCKKFLEWVPYLPADIKWLVEKLIQTFQSIMSNFSKKEENLMATINCEMSVTQVNYSENVLNPAPQHDNCGCRKISVIKPQTTNTNVQFSVEVDKDNLPIGALHQEKNEYKKLKHLTSAYDRDTNQLNILQAQYNSETLDSFEQVLDITNKMDSVLSFYYMDDKKRVAVREIFGSNDPQVKAELNSDERKTNRSLSWDYFVEPHNDEESDIDFSDLSVDLE